MQQLAIIHKPVFGVHEKRASLLFEVRWIDSAGGSNGAIVAIDARAAATLVEVESIRDIYDLHGKACVVETEVIGRPVKFLHLFNPDSSASSAPPR